MASSSDAGAAAAAAAAGAGEGATPVAIVVGGSYGIGEGVSLRLAQDGNIVVIASRDGEQVKPTLQKIAEAGGKGFWLQCDVSLAEDVEKLVKTVLAEHGNRIDILVQNAGLIPEHRMEVMTLEDWDRVMSVNLRGTFIAVKAVLPHMQARRYGRIVLTSSITGPETGIPGFAHYGATKAGMEGFMRSVAIEVAKHGITINAVRPGNILTAGLAKLGEEYLANQVRSIPMNRLGTPADIGHAVSFFAARASAWITGQTLVVDGGQLLPESHFCTY